jgi:hypothetical protein
MRSLGSLRRRTVKPLVLSALQPLLAIAAVSGLLCTSALAATHTASVLVSATVVSGCQVSPALSAAQRAASATDGWSASVSVSCSLPVSYQVAVGNSAGIELAGLGPASPLVTAYGRTRDLASPRTPDEPTPAAAGDDHGLAELIAAQSSVGPGDRPADGSDPGTVIVTIVY